MEEDQYQEQQVYHGGLHQQEGFWEDVFCHRWYLLLLRQKTGGPQVIIQPISEGSLQPFAWQEGYDMDSGASLGQLGHQEAGNVGPQQFNTQQWWAAIWAELTWILPRPMPPDFYGQLNYVSQRVSPSRFPLHFYEKRLQRLHADLETRRRRLHWMRHH